MNDVIDVGPTRRFGPMWNQIARALDSESLWLVKLRLDNICFGRRVSMNAALIHYGAGTGVVHFIHTDSAYAFGAAIIGNGAANQIDPGTTILTAATQQVRFARPIDLAAADNLRPQPLQPPPVHEVCQGLAFHLG
ncbi:hypothetical protein ACFIOY_31740 [Bradyrhizobium sp. TZ2]|jgi:hypothetical protein